MTIREIHQKADKLIHNAVIKVNNNTRERCNEYLDAARDLACTPHRVDEYRAKEEILFDAYQTDTQPQRYNFIRQRIRIELVRDMMIAEHWLKAMDK